MVCRRLCSKKRFTNREIVGEVYVALSEALLQLERVIKKMKDLLTCENTSLWPHSTLFDTRVNRKNRQIFHTNVTSSNSFVRFLHESEVYSASADERTFFFAYLIRETYLQDSWKEIVITPARKDRILHA